MFKNFEKSYKIIYKSDENTLYMKVSQNDETNPNKQLVRPPHIPSIANLQHFTSGSFVQKGETLGILSRMFPPLPVSPTAALGNT